RSVEWAKPDWLGWLVRHPEHCMEDERVLSRRERRATFVVEEAHGSLAASVPLDGPLIRCVRIPSPGFSAELHAASELATTDGDPVHCIPCETGDTRVPETLELAEFSTRPHPERPLLSAGQGDNDADHDPRQAGPDCALDRL